MGNLDAILASEPPRTLAGALTRWPVRDAYLASPADWRDELFYFLLPDRFSDGREDPSRLLTADLASPAGVAAVAARRGPGWSWNAWQRSGRQRFQGGTLEGARSKLGYLSDLGVSTLWLGPVFRQRAEEDTYHGYGIQDFLDVDPRLGSRADLVQLVDEAHARKLKVVLDVIFNHSGCNWLYDATAGNGFEPPYRSRGGYQPIWPRSGLGSAVGAGGAALGRDDYVWPGELRGQERYLRAGRGDLGAGAVDDDRAEHKRTDFCGFRKFDLFSEQTLSALLLVYHYWIALADLDGFRIDTLKHVTQEQARTFCNGIKEYAEQLGKDHFFLVGEVAGGSSAQDRYLDVTGRNLDACLDIGEQRELLCRVGKGLAPPGDLFAGFAPWDPGMGSHRNWGSRHLTVSNDHDQVSGAKLRLASDASNDHQGAAVTALQLFTLGIPCLYQGVEQGLAGGAEPGERRWLESWGGDDALLREAMFGPERPRASGWAGTQGARDPELPGFGPHGTCGWHVFNPRHPTYLRIAQLAAARRSLKPLRRGRQYQRQTSLLDQPFGLPGSGELMAWSRVFDDQEVLVVVNTHGRERRGARVAVDRTLSSGGMQVVAQTDSAAGGATALGGWIAASAWGDWRYLRLDQELLGPSEVMVLANQSAVESAGIGWKGPGR